MKKEGKKRKQPLGGLAALAEALAAEPQAKANNLPVLLAALKPGCAEATPVLHHLRIFFIDAFDRGDLSVTPPPEGDASPEAVFAAWLRRQYLAYTAALLRLLGAPAADARTQVAAFVAVMECVRGERPGVFNNRLYHRALEALVARPGAAPEALGLLIARFLGLADVRYFTLASIAKLARQAQQAAAAAGAAGGPRAAAGGGGYDSGAEEEAQQGQQGGEAESDEEAAAAAAGGSGSGEEGGRVSRADLVRTLHDLLAEMPPEPPGMAAPGAAATKRPPAAGQEGSEGEDEEEEGDQAGALKSWCGAAEVGIVAAAIAAQGSRARKRQRLHLEQAAAAAAGEQQHAKWANVKAQQRAYSDAWLALLRCELPKDIYKKVLPAMADRIIPALANPLLLADFLTATLDHGGLTGMLALNGIFLLVTRHGLEYPHFYRRLYQLLNPDAFHAKHRARFWSLADVFLASGMVPAYTAAAFVKRLLRLALAAPPAGALLALAFAHNIVRRHPATMQLLHRPPRGGLTAVGAPAAAAVPAAPQPLLPLPPQVAGQQQQQAQQPQANGAAAAAAAAAAPQQQQQPQQQQVGQGPVWQGQDVYDFAEPDPGASRALESSLWELEALRRHANPQVSAYCAVLDKDLRDRKKTSEVDVSELLAASYASMFAAEAARRLKQVPTAFYRAPPQRLFEGGAAAADWAGWAL